MDIGKLGETIACKYLRAKGYKIIEQNFRIRGGEIDIICAKAGTLVFVEVKTRTQTLGGNPEDAITPGKIYHLRQAIYTYVSSKPIHYKAIRIDVISITFIGTWPQIQHFENITE